MPEKEHGPNEHIERYRETPIGRPAVVYMPERFLATLRNSSAAAEIASRFGGYTEVKAGSAHLGAEGEPMGMLITAFGGDSIPEKAIAKQEAIAKIRWLKKFLTRFMKENNLPSVYLETGEDAQMLTLESENGNTIETDLGRPAIVYLPSEKITSTIRAELKQWAEQFPFWQISDEEGKSDWAGTGTPRSEIMCKVSFAGKDRVPTLKQAIAELCAKLDEPALHLETGEDAWLIDPKHPDGEPQGRAASFYLPAVKADQATQERIISFLQANFGNYKYRAGGAVGRWRDAASGQWFDDHNILFKTAFVDDSPDKDKIRKLKNFLADLATDTNELAIYLETGEDAFIIEPKKA